MRGIVGEERRRTDVSGELPFTHSLTFYSLSIFLYSPLLLSLLVILALTVTVMVTVT
jgi:hypothetical protein